MAELGGSEDNGQSRTGQDHGFGGKVDKEHVKRALDKFDEKRGEKDEKPEDEKEKPEKRHIRKVSKVRRALAAADAFFAIGSSTPEVPHNPPTELGPMDSGISIFDEPTNHDPKFYDTSTQGMPPQPNGEVDTSLGRLPVEGVHIKVDPSKLNLPPDRVVRVSVVEPDPDEKDGVYHGDTVTLDPSHIGGKVPEPETSFGAETDDAEGLRVSGSDKGAVVVETFDQAGTQTSSEQYPEKFNQPLSGETNTVISEVSDPKSEQHINETLSLFKPFLKTDVDFVVNNAKGTHEREGSYGDGTQVVRVSVPELQDIEGHDTKNDTSFHELTHAAFHSLDQKQQDKLGKVYDNMKHNMRYKIPTTAEASSGYVGDNEPAWAAITESTYYKKLGVQSESDAGHPFDNKNEMFASTMNVLKTFPDLFLEEYSHLPVNERHAVAMTVLASIDAMKSLNPDDEALKKLLPNLPNIVDKLQDDPANGEIKSQLEGLAK